MKEKKQKRKRSKRKAGGEEFKKKRRSFPLEKRNDATAFPFAILPRRTYSFESR